MQHPLNLCSQSQATTGNSVAAVGTKNPDVTISRIFLLANQSMPRGMHLPRKNRVVPTNRLVVVILTVQESEVPWLLSRQILTR